MKLWAFDAYDVQYARASHVGTWVEVGDPPRDERVKPLVIQWEPGSTVIGDFTWVGTSSYVVKRSVAEELLEAGFKGFELGPVEIVPNRHHKKPKRNILQLPNVQPDLVDLWVTKWVPFNHERTTVHVVGEEGGKPIYELDGIEMIEVGNWHPETGTLDKIRIPRTPERGLYVDARELGDCDIFRTTELPVGINCTDRLRNFIVDKGYTNIVFFEVGETID
jgi:hypothetical protein